MKNEFRMPNGKWTRDAKKMSRAWERIYKPICKELGLGVIGYDPGILFKYGNCSFDIPIDLVIKISNLIKERDKYKKMNGLRIVLPTLNKKEDKMFGIELEGTENEETGMDVYKCPICDQVICNGEESLDVLACEHILMIYSDMVGSTCYTHPDMVKVEKEFDKKMEDNYDRDEDLINFTDLMEEYAKLNSHEIYTITTSGMCCGPCSNTDYIMIGKIKKVKKVKKTKKVKKGKK